MLANFAVLHLTCGFASRDPRCDAWGTRSPAYLRRNRSAGLESKGDFRVGGGEVGYLPQTRGAPRGARSAK
eukprot:3321623-Prymnesium_polylepis.1